MAWTLELGAKAPDFNLKGVDGKQHSLADYAEAKALCVIVSCNHCPTVVQYEDRMVKIQKDYADKGVQLVAINPNETDGHPTDSFDHMVERAKEKGFNFPYLRDDTICDSNISTSHGTGSRHYFPVPNHYIEHSRPPPSTKTATRRQ